MSATRKQAQKPDQWTLRQLRLIAQYQFSAKFAEVLIPDAVQVTFSKKTGKVREVLLAGKRLATLRAQDSLFSLGLEGAKRAIQLVKSPKHRVIIQTDVAEFIAVGRNVFAKHVVGADPEILPEDEVIVVSEEDQLLAVGRAKLSAKYMLAFQKGVAVNVRYGINQRKD